MSGSVEIAKSMLRHKDGGLGNFNRTRHIAVRYFCIKQLVDDKSLQIDYLPTGQMKSRSLDEACQKLTMYIYNAKD